MVILYKYVFIIIIIIIIISSGIVRISGVEIENNELKYIPLPWSNQKQENNEASQSEVKTIQLYMFAPFFAGWQQFKLPLI